MNLQQLYYFQKIAECQQYTQAAKELHVTQATLSYAISNLEKELRVRHGECRPHSLKRGSQPDTTDQHQGHQQHMGAHHRGNSLVKGHFRSRGGTPYRPPIRWRGRAVNDDFAELRTRQRGHGAGADDEAAEPPG